MFEVNVVERQGFAVAGCKVRTSMEKAMQDCSKLWQADFGPRMGELCAGPCESYGISQAVIDAPDGSEAAGACAFDYYAALPFPADKALPKGFVRAQVPAGLYAECPVPSLDQLGGAYTFIFTDWLPKHPEYVVNMAAPSYEVYPADHMEHGRLVLYFPVRKA